MAVVRAAIDGEAAVQLLLENEGFRGQIAQIFAVFEGESGLSTPSVGIHGVSFRK
jgi:hypothetical protein